MRTKDYLYCPKCDLIRTDLHKYCCQCGTQLEKIQRINNHNIKRE